MTDENSKIKPRNSLRVLRYRNFTIFWSGALVSNTGSWMQSIAVPFILYQMTHSTTWLGLGAFMAFFPALCVGPLAGSLSDRYDRKLVLLWSQSVMMIFAFSLWWVWISGWASPEVILVLLALSSTASGISISAWQAFIPQLVPPADMLPAVRVNSMQFVASRAFGPALAGLILAKYGPGTAFLLNAFSFVLVLIALVVIRPRMVARDRDVGNIREHFREALRYINAHPALKSPVVVIMVISFFGSSVVQLIPALAEGQFAVGKSQYGFLVAAFGAGAILGSIFVSVRADHYLRSQVALVGIFIYAAGEIILAATNFYAVGVAGMLVMGWAYVLLATALNTSIHAQVDEAYRGRVISIYLMGLLAGAPLGALAQGLLASWIGLAPTIILAGAALGVCGLIAQFRFNGLRALDENLEIETGRASDLIIGTPPAIASLD